MSEDYYYLSIAKTIARSNPDGDKQVGAVIVRHGLIVGTGFRKTTIIKQNPLKDITVHAEHSAILEAGKFCEGATIYVTMEPCTKRACLCEFDVNESCCDLIIKAGIKRVVFEVNDPLFGKGGHGYLIENGITVDQYSL